MAKPPYSSGTDRPNPPSSASPSITSSGMSAFVRCTCSACGPHLLLGEAVERLAHQLEVLAQVPRPLGRGQRRQHRRLALRLEEGGGRRRPTGLDAPERLAARRPCPRGRPPRRPRRQRRWPPRRPLARRTGGRPGPCPPRPRRARRRRPRPGWRRSRRGRGWRRRPGRRALGPGRPRRRRRRGRRCRAKSRGATLMAGPRAPPSPARPLGRGASGAAADDRHQRWQHDRVVARDRPPSTTPGSPTPVPDRRPPAPRPTRRPPRATASRTSAGNSAPTSGWRASGIDRGDPSMRPAEVIGSCATTQPPGRTDAGHLARRPRPGRARAGGGSGRTPGRPPRAATGPRRPG